MIEVFASPSAEGKLQSKSAIGGSHAESVMSETRGRGCAKASLPEHLSACENASGC